jgi:hypothetical protein
MSPKIEPIGDEDLPEFCAFLNKNLGPDRPMDRWATIFQQGWDAHKPNNGFLMRDENGALVGGIGAVYAERVLRGRSERFCNITSWCVLEPYRTHSLRLALALVAQPGYHFTDLSPTQVVAGSLQFLKFRPMNGAAIVIPNLPWWTPGVRVLSDLEAIAAALSSEDAKTFADHRHLPELHHVAVGRPGAYCHVGYRRGILRRLPCAVILHISDPDLFLRYHLDLGRHLLLRRGLVTTRVEARLLPRHPRLSARVDGYYKKVFRSDTLAESDISNFYSELAVIFH